jgi:hypothetical protein
MTEQVPTRRTSHASVMRSTAFKQGVAEVRAASPPDFDTETADIDWCWNYERGRQWATAAPKDMPLMIGGRLNPRALALFRRGPFP